MSAVDAVGPRPVDAPADPVAYFAVRPAPGGYGIVLIADK
jgi:hypothetical protein